MSTSSFPPADPSLSGNVNPEALDRYFSGASAPDESAAVEAALLDSPAVANAVHHDHARAPDVDALWHRFTASGRLATRTKPAVTASSRRAKSWSMHQIAGALFTVLVVALTIPALLRQVQSSNDHGIEYVTAIGERSTVELAAGIRATIAPASTLRYRVASDGAAMVELDGEAYFHIEARSERPFAVRTGGVTTRVLGTAFNVRRYADDSVAQVSVVLGKVAVHTRLGGALVVLTPGMIAHASDSVTRVTGTTGAEQSTAWADGQLVFENTPVPEMLKTLGRWYGYRFAVQDSALARKRVSTVLMVHRSSETLTVLKDLLNVTMDFQDSVIVLRPARESHGDNRQSTPYRRAAIESTRVGK